MPLPWTQIIQWVELSRDLLQRSKQRPASGTDLTPIDSTADMASRVAALEENERRQAELVSQMAQHQGQLSTAVVELHGAELALLARPVGEWRQDDTLHARRPQRRIDALRGVDEPAANGSSAAHSLSACLWERPTGRDCAPQEVPLGCSRRYRGQ